MIHITKPFNVMPQVTLSVPQEKLPLLRDVLTALGIDDIKSKDLLPKASYAKMSRSIRKSANNIYRKYFSWEYFSNELEFE